MTERADPEQIAAVVGGLRRYARAALGDAERADACVTAALERAPQALRAVEPLAPLYHAVYRELRGTPSSGAPAAGLVERLRRLDDDARHALLLCRLEGLDAATVAEVMEVGEAEVAARLQAARDGLREPSHAAVLIIEDDLAVAGRISKVVAGLGHDVTAVAHTADEAVVAARDRRPDVVLADLELGGEHDGMAAIDAVRAEDASLPAIFVTGFPERLGGDGARAPDCLVRKPIDDRLLASAFARALGVEAAAPAG